jgi:regulator of replication initiation timing
VNDSELQELHQVHTEAYAQITVALANARWDLKQVTQKNVSLQQENDYLRRQLSQQPSPGTVIDGKVES